MAYINRICSAHLHLHTELMIHSELKVAMKYFFLCFVLNLFFFSTIIYNNKYL